jgi:hypothetical protein
MLKKHITYKNHLKREGREKKSNGVQNSKKKSEKKRGLKENQKVKSAKEVNEKGSNLLLTHWL